MRVFLNLSAALLRTATAYLLADIATKFGMQKSESPDDTRETLKGATAPKNMTSRSFCSDWLMPVPGASQPPPLAARHQG